MAKEKKISDANILLEAKNYFSKKKLKIKFYKTNLTFLMEKVVFGGDGGARKIRWSCQDVNLSKSFRFHLTKKIKFQPSEMIFFR